MAVPWLLSGIVMAVRFSTVQSRVAKSPSDNVHVNVKTPFAARKRHYSRTQRRGSMCNGTLIAALKEGLPTTS